MNTVPSQREVRARILWPSILAVACSVAIFAALPRMFRPLWLSVALLLTINAALRAGAAAGLATGLFASALGLLLQPPSLRATLPLLLLPVLGAFAGQLRMRIERRAEPSRSGGLSLLPDRDGVWEWELAENRLALSEQLRGLIGAEGDGRASDLDALRARVHPRDASKFSAELESLRRGRRDRVKLEHRLRVRDGRWAWVQTQAVLARDASKNPQQVTALSRVLMTAHDEPNTVERASLSAAQLDALTGLPNRALFFERVRHAIARRKRPPAPVFALIVLDLDEFAELNHKLGQDLADQLVARVAERLRQAVREGDTVARLGADEFGILLEGIGNEQEAERRAAQLTRTVRTPSIVNGREVRVTASMGMVLAESGLQSAQALVRQAEVACELAQRKGSGESVSFAALDQAEWSSRPPLEDALREALKRGDLGVHFQPIVTLPDARLAGFEALLRWHDPSLGRVTPMEIVHVAEQAGLIDELDGFVLAQACSTLKAMQALRGVGEPLYVAINASARELASRGFVTRVKNVLKATALSPHMLAIELREAALMDGSSEARACFAELRALGVRVHMDDFGTGYSSLSYLHRVQLDALKIDASCIHELEHGDEEIARTAVTIGHSLHLRVMAEGVETAKQLETLVRLGYDEAQGHLFGPPLPRDELEAYVRQHVSQRPPPMR